MSRNSSETPLLSAASHIALPVCNTEPELGHGVDGLFQARWVHLEQLELDVQSVVAQHTDARDVEIFVP